MSPLGIGVIGLGRWGQRYLKTLTSLASCRLVAAADLAGSRSSLQFPAGTAVYDSARQLVEDASVEAAIIATPDHTHAALARLCLEAGRDVLVEKPMTVDPDSASAVVELAESSGRILAVGHTTLYHPGFAEVLAATQSGILGRTHHATAVRTSGGDGRTCGSITRDLMPHDLAMAMSLMGRPLAVRARSKWAGHAVAYQLAFAGDVVWSGWNAWHHGPHTRRLRITGELGSLRFLDIADHLRFEEMPLTRQCRDFIEACRGRRTPLSTGRLGLDVVQVMQAAVDSAADGGRWTPTEGSRVSSTR